MRFLMPRPWNPDEKVTVVLLVVWFSSRSKVYWLYSWIWMILVWSRLRERLDPLGQPAGLHDELCLVETALGVDVAVDGVDGEHVRRVRVRVPVEVRQRGGLEGVREGVGVVEVEHHADE
ncbi:hypothetical protein KL909_002469 [Ogataea angusta]|nr:hypothetical protein KL909_002469 [Ogataea angusta]